MLVVSPIAGLLLAGLLMAVLNLWLGDGGHGPFPGAGPGQVLVGQRVAESAPPEEVRFVAWGAPRLKGFAHPVKLLEARRA